jgi:glyoxylase-like metal-dependent hydrolase (beta-lactamase superfamily II)
MDRWFDGVYLLDRVTWIKTGVWMLVHRGEAAVLELPPAEWGSPDPVELAATGAAALSATVRFILCTHAHLDHFNLDTFHRMCKRFPQAEPVLQSGFRHHTGTDPAITYFDADRTLFLGGEPLHLLHAPKHSLTDTMVIFRGSVCTGDWELNTIRTVNERVPVETRLGSCARVIEFLRHANYHVHRVYSAHANDRREGVDFPALIADTQRDRKLW